MDLASTLYLGFTLLLFLIFACIVMRTLSAGNRKKGEEAKYRMMDE